MGRDTNIATQQKAAEHLNAHDVDAGVDAMFAETAVDHDPAPGQGPGREGFRTFWRMMVAAFPDFQITPATLVADDEQVTVVYTLSGTHQGEFQGIAPTGNRIEIRGVQVGRFADGQIVERWGSSDELTLMRQLGAEPSDGNKGKLGKVADALRS